MANEINVYRGNDRTVIVNIIDDDLLPVGSGLRWADYREKSVIMYVKLNATDKDEKAVLTKTGIIDTTVNGKVVFALEKADTSNSLLKDNTPYICEVKCYLDGEIYTALITELTIIR